MSEVVPKKTCENCGKKSSWAYENDEPYCHDCTIKIASRRKKPDCIICEEGIKDGYIYNLDLLCEKHKKELQEEWKNRKGVKASISILD